MRILPLSLVLVLVGCKDNGQDSAGRTSASVPEFEDVNGTGVSVAAYDMSKVIEDENGVKLLSNRLDVRVKEDTTDAQAQEIAASIGGTLIAKNEPLRYYSIEIPETDVEGIRSALEQLAREEAVTFAEPVFLNGEAATDNEDYANQDTLWAFTTIQLYEAHDLIANYNPTNIIVGVIDSGLTTYHADNPDESEINLDSRTQYWYNFVSGESDATEKRGEEDEGYGHGTAVAGVIAAKNNENGINGVAYTSNVLPLNVFDELTGAPPSAIADAIAYAATPPVSARVINLSLAVDFEGIDAWYNFFDEGEDAYSKLEAAVRYSDVQGTIIVAAAGNEAKDSSYQLPAASKYVISVGATNETDQRWGDSNYSVDDNIDYLGIAAPGSNVATASIKNEDGDIISSFSGTSAAAPMVSGLAALVLSVTDEDYTTEEMLSLLREHADMITVTYPDGSEHTWYRINACKTIAAVLGEDESVCEESTTTDPNDTDDDGDGYTENEEDCDDTDATSYPGASEDCSDGANNDCDDYNDAEDSDCATGCPDVASSTVYLYIDGSQEATISLPSFSGSMEIQLGARNALYDNVELIADCETLVSEDFEVDEGCFDAGSISSDGNPSNALSTGSGATYPQCSVSSFDPSTQAWYLSFDSKPTSSTAEYETATGIQGTSSGMIQLAIDTNASGSGDNVSLLTINGDSESFTFAFDSAYHTFIISNYEL